MKENQKYNNYNNLYITINFPINFKTVDNRKK